MSVKTKLALAFAVIVAMVWMSPGPALRDSGIATEPSVGRFERVVSVATPMRDSASPPPSRPRARRFG
jgi:hypothetical protein